MAHYKTDSLNVTYGEYWRIAPNPLVLFVWVPKLLGIRVNIASGIPGAVPVRDMLATPEELPENARASFMDAEAELARQGLRLQNYCAVRDSLIVGGQVFCADFSEGSGELRARVFVALQGPKLRRTVAILTPLADGRTFITADRPSEFRVSFVVRQVMRNKPLEQLVRAHQRKFEEFRIRPGIKRYSPLEFHSFVDEYEFRCFNEYLQRGLYIEMTPEEVAAARAAKGDVAPRPGEGAETSGVSQSQSILNALNHGMQEKPNVWQGITILIFSLVAFAALGTFRWSPTTIALLIGILFFHELGHFLAMKLFRYRNVRMFFIPFFGAAVTGQKLETAGCKKAVVALAGPLPGIAVGFALSIICIVVESPSLEKLALMLVLLNGFNLLPFLPLDGGWVLQALFFGRSPRAEVVFKMVAGIGILLLAIDSRSILLGFLGAFSLMQAPFQFKLAKVAREVKALPRAEPLPEEGFSPELVHEISQRISPLTPDRSTKTMANFTRAVYDKVIEKPPGFLGTGALFLVYAGAILVAFCGWIFVELARSERLNESGDESPAQAVSAPTLGVGVKFGE